MLSRVPFEVNTVVLTKELHPRAFGLVEHIMDTNKAVFEATGVEEVKMVRWGGTGQRGVIFV